MRSKLAEMRWQFHEPLRSASWHFEGKHFVTSHTDGSLCTWPLRSTTNSAKPQLHVFPHGKFFFCCLAGAEVALFGRCCENIFNFHVFAAKPTKDGKLEACKPIHKVEVKTTRIGYVLRLQVFSLSL